MHINDNSQPVAVGLMLILLILWLSITNHLQESRAGMAEFGAGSQEPGSSSECRVGLRGKSWGGRKEKPLLWMVLLQKWH